MHLAQDCAADASEGDAAGIGTGGTQLPAAPGGLSPVGTHWGGYRNGFSLLVVSYVWSERLQREARDEGEYLHRLRCSHLVIGCSLPLTRVLVSILSFEEASFSVLGEQNLFSCTACRHPICGLQPIPQHPFLSVFIAYLGSIQGKKRAGVDTLLDLGWDHAFTARYCGEGALEHIVSLHQCCCHLGCGHPAS